MAKKSIEYSDISWNPFSGCLALDCAVRNRKACWAEKMANRQKGQNGYDRETPFRPTFHPDKLRQPYHWKKPRRIAACFMGDFAFAQMEVQKAILEVANMTQRHRYYFLTKQPHLIKHLIFPENIWLGVTINCQKDLWRIDELSEINAKVKFGSFEPLYDELTLDDLLHYLDWIIIGAQTNPPKQPKRVWIENILDSAEDLGMPVFMKDNLRFEPKLLEFPLGLKV